MKTQRSRPRRDGVVRTPMLLLVAALALVLAACGDAAQDGEPATTTLADEEFPVTTTAPGQLVPGTGEAIIADEVFVLDPSLQCGIFPGPTVSIAGTIEDGDGEFVIDYDPANDLVGMSIGESPDDDPFWSARGDDIEFTVDGDTIRGEGTFEDGQGNEAPGTVEVTC